MFILANIFVQRSKLAVKVLRKDRGLRKKIVKQFHKEAEILKKIRHPHIVRGLESGRTENGVDYLVMEYAPKGTLRDAYHRKTHPYPGP